ncbi:MAG TPA: hypothetical protein PKO06_09740 [Candidatus Ozemobacteraceae bacterium]|nr:hypothetical protein [Candidatus Ozemobacteraceae bacterium]
MKGIGVGCVVLVLLFMLTSAIEARETGQTIVDTQMLSTFAKVDLKDGVSQDEARVLAGDYLLHFVSGCGGIAEIKDKGAAWEATPLVGRGATPGEVILVDKKTGKLSSVRGPTIVAPVEQNSDELSTPPAELDAKIFELGEITSTTRDEELHQIKLGLTISYKGDETVLTQQTETIRDQVVQLLMKMTMEKAQEAFTTRTLHSDIEAIVRKAIAGAAAQSFQLRDVQLVDFLVK